MSALSSSSDESARRRFARLAAWVIAVSSLSILAVALAAQYIGGLAPCPLCLLQRYPYGLAIGLAVLLLLFDPAPHVRSALLALCGLVLLADAGIAAYHAGVEYGWFAGPSTCTAETGTATTLEALRAQVMAAPIVACNEVPWSLFGISIAGYNVMAAGALAGFSLTAAYRSHFARRP